MRVGWSVVTLDSSECVTLGGCAVTSSPALLPAGVIGKKSSKLPTLEIVWYMYMYREVSLPDVWTNFQILGGPSSVT